MLLSGLYDFVAKNARVQCRVKWTPNTLVMRNNPCVQHQAVRNYVGFARHGECVSILDGKPPKAAHYWILGYPATLRVGMATLPCGGMVALGEDFIARFQTKYKPKR